VSRLRNIPFSHFIAHIDCTRWGFHCDISVPVCYILWLCSLPLFFYLWDILAKMMSLKLRDPLAVPSVYRKFRSEGSSSMTKQGSQETNLKCRTWHNWPSFCSNDTKRWGLLCIEKGSEDIMNKLWYIYEVLRISASSQNSYAEALIPSGCGALGR
jgi:hypothetical protein